MRTFDLCLGLAVLALATASCDDRLDMLTVINPDGSCVREISIPADSLLLTGVDSLEHLGNLMRDESWEKSWRMKGSQESHPYPMTVGQYDSVMAALRTGDGSGRTEDNLSVCVSRSFGSVAEMGAALPLKVGGRSVRASAGLEKRFRWFSTDYRFNETFSGFGDCFSVPVDGFLEDDEASYWLTGTPDITNGGSGLEVKEMLDDIEERFWNWVGANCMSVALDEIAGNYGLIGDAPVDRDAFVAGRDSLLRYLVGNGYGIWNDSEYSFVKGLDNFFDTDAYGKALGTDDEGELSGLIERRLGFYESLRSLRVDYGVRMPGDAGERHFVLSGPRMALDDYGITVTSHVPNWWAYALTLLAALLAVTLTIALKRR